MKIKLGDAFDLEMGKTPLRSNKLFWNGTNSWVSIADLSKSGKYLSETKEKITDDAIFQTGITKVPKNTLIMSFKLSIGKCAITDKDLFTNEAIMAFINKGSFSIDNDYLYHYLSNLDFSRFGNKAVMGVTLNKKTLERFSIELPDLKEQKDIANKFNLLDSIIENKKDQIIECDQLIRSRFIEMFGDPIINSLAWPVEKLKEVSKIGSSKRVFQKDYVKSGIPFYRSKEIVNLSNGQPIKTELYIDSIYYEKLKSKYGVPEKGDLLVTAVGTIGNIWIVDGARPFYFKDGNILSIKMLNQFSPVFMRDLLEILIANYKESMPVGTAYAALTIEKLSEFQIINPPLELQDEYAEFLGVIDKSKYCYLE